MLKKGEDYYEEGGFWVFTEKYHARRGYCCGTGCRHCPYLPEHKRASTTLQPAVSKSKKS
jgi:hypothetical protein